MPSMGKEGVSAEKNVLAWTAGKLHNVVQGTHTNLHRTKSQVNMREPTSM